MFHQLNLRVADVLPTTINGVTKQRSLYQMWAESVGHAFTSLVNWPIVNINNDALFDYFTARMNKDQCNASTQLLLKTSGNTTQIVGFIVDCAGHSCPEPIPVTIPGGDVTDLQGATREKVGNDPLTLWVKLSGSPLTFTLTTPISL
jgi:hypothetical protein